ncbi:GOLPH3/VPS74 family protein [Pseudonocardia humida]|uniref:GPP34 family phosphoprotein n=1 Tax=Pseudonocardia humida TaxID=2800819 RepID=A0ABT1A1Y5_9PSEU|nr:GPP34 family phosphoprotein [Pseudonocardia humida]MCO1656943.1 GPP34 family phosphoprotein [Pseudonocardia humida]
MERDELAAGFFLIAHDEFSGKLRVNRERLGYGLVAAELAQLLVAGRIALADGRVVLTDSYTVEPNEVDGYVLDTIQRHVSVRSVRAWADSLAQPLYDLISRRLESLGVVRRESGGGLVRRKPDRFPGVDLLAAARPRMRLERMIGSPRELDLPGAFTASLLWTLGLEGVLDPEIDRSAARELVRQVNEHLPADLHTVLAGVRAAAEGD